MLFTSSIWFDAKSIGWIIIHVYINESRVGLSKLKCTSVPEGQFYLIKLCRP